MDPLDASKHNKYVYLYTGDGTGEVSRAQAEKSFNHYLGGRSTRLITINDPSYFQNPKRILDPEALVFPGGSAFEMKTALLNSGIEGIKSIVGDAKAAYIGFCAGGYLAGRTNYTPGNSTTPLLMDFGLSLSGYTNYGPAYPMRASPSLKTAQAVPVQSLLNRQRESEPFYVYWNGGGYYTFVNPFQDSTLAYYVSSDLVPRERTAIVSERYKCTQVVISYVHPEIRLSQEEVERYIPHLDHKEEYLASAPQQEMLFNAICAEAGIKKGI